MLFMFAVRRLLITLPAAWICLQASSVCDGAPIDIKEPKAGRQIDFAGDVLPVLRKKCLACHNAVKAEADLVLETPATISESGHIEPGSSADSYLLDIASHREEPFMPPEDNDVGAVPMTPGELGLLKAWIDQGAEGEVDGQSITLDWQPLPAVLHTIFAVAVSPDAQYVACARANQIFMYHVKTGRLSARLSDPVLAATGLYGSAGAAHADLVQSLCFDPGGDVLISTGYRTVKIWQRPQGEALRRLPLSSSAAAMAISPDRKTLAVAQRGGSLSLWDAGSGDKLTELPRHRDVVTDLSFSPNGKILYSASADGMIRGWDVKANLTAAVIRAPAGVSAVVVLRQGKLVVAGSTDGVLRTWRVKHPPGSDEAAIEMAREIVGHAQAISSLAAVAGDSAKVVSASLDGTARLWDVEADPPQLRTFKHGAAITSLAVRPDGKQVATAGRDGVVRLWNLADGKQLAEMKGDYRLAAARSAAQGDVDRIAKLTDAAQKDLEAASKDVKQKSEAAKKASEGVVAARDDEKTKRAASEKAATLVTATEKKSAEATAAQQEASRAVTSLTQAIATAKRQLESVEKSHAQAQAKAQPSPDDKQLAAAADAAEKAVITARQYAAGLATAETVLKQLAAERAKHVQAAGSELESAKKAAASADAAAQKAADVLTVAQRKVADTTSDQARSEQAEAAAHERLRELTEVERPRADNRLAAATQTAERNQQAILAVAYSANGRSLAAGGETGLVHIWKSPDGEPIETYAGHEGPVTAAVFDDQGRVISSSSDATAIVWKNDAAWKLKQTIGDAAAPDIFADRVIAAAVSPNGQLLATGGGEPSRSGELKLWRLPGGELVRTIPDAHSDTIFGLEFSPDGKYLASCGADKFLKVFDVATGELVRSFEGHTDHVLDVAWKWDGKRLASVGADLVVKIWNAETGERLRDIRGFGKPVTSVSFLGDTSDTLCTSGEGKFRRDNSDNGRSVRNLAGAGDFLHTSSVTPDGRLAAAGGSDGVLRIWDTGSGKLLYAFEPPAQRSREVAQKPTR